MALHLLVVYASKYNSGIRVYIWGETSCKDFVATIQGAQGQIVQNRIPVSKHCYRMQFPKIVINPLRATNCNVPRSPFSAKLMNIKPL